MRIKLTCNVYRKVFPFLLAVLLLSICFTTVNAKEGGECIEGDCVNGEGTYVYNDGTRYIGESKNGMRDEQGTMIWANGDKYVGTWRNGKRYDKKERDKDTLISIGVAFFIIVFDSSLYVIARKSVRKNNRDFKHIADSLNLSYSYKADKQLLYLLRLADYKYSFIRCVMSGNIKDIYLSIFRTCDDEYVDTKILFKSNMLDLPSFDLSLNKGIITFWS